MKKVVLFITLLAAITNVSDAATVTVTNVDNGTNNVGAAGTFYWAITNCNAGDTIAFNIPGAGPFYFKEPTNGFPLIYRKGNLTVDGYTQPGASPNSNPITGTNNAVIKVVIDARNGGTRDMNYPAYGTTVTSDPPINNAFMVNERGGYSSTERALLGVYRSTNVNIRGLAFLGGATTRVSGGVMKGICFAHDYDGDTTVTNQAAYVNGWAYQSGSDRNGHVNGCWFGIDPTNQSEAAIFGFPPVAETIAITAYRDQDVSGGPRPELPNVGLIIGVAPGSSNPRAEFNVFAGAASICDGEALRTRVSGNFIHVMPDGVTPVTALDFLIAGYAAPVPVQIARYDDTQPIVIGTDGDGVNDADEGNLFGPIGPVGLTGGAAVPEMYSYSTGNKPWIIAGNTFGIGNDGTVWPDNSISIGIFYIQDGTKVRFGSDFNGVSDALEANRVYNNHVFNDPYMFGSTPWENWNDPIASAWPKDLFGMGSASVNNGTNVYQPANPSAFVSIRGNVLVNNFPSMNPGDTNVGIQNIGPLTGQFYTNIWSNYVLNASQTIPALSASSVSVLSGTCGYPTNGYTNLFVDVYLPDPEGQTNGAQFGEAEFGGTNGWGFVQGRTYLGSFMDNSSYDSNPAVGAFSFNIRNLGLTAGTKVTVAVTYSSDARPNVTAITRNGNNVTLTWTGGNGSGTSGFGVQRAGNVLGPWTTVGFSPTNSIVLTDTASASFYRILGPGTGMTTLFAPPMILTP
jgi:hypothetical protein